MGFAPLEEIEGPIVLPLKGREVTLPVLSLEEGVRLQNRLAEGGVTEGELASVLLGPVLPELVSAGVAAPVISRVVAVAIAEWRFGREAAEKAWADPKALVEMTQRLTAAVEAATTQLRASTTSTTSLKAPTKVPRSRGKKSSATGASS
jgi:hypothetical protein